ncbi:MAG: hypothetical protein AAGJ79_03275, partial [Verrucomicrobiota bacterium]
GGRRVPNDPIVIEHDAARVARGGGLEHHVGLDEVGRGFDREFGRSVAVAADGELGIGCGAVGTNAYPAAGANEELVGAGG